MQRRGLYLNIVVVFLINMIFGSLNYNLIAIDKEQFSTKFGALIAGQDFLISLLMYGNFDEYHFFTYSKKKGEIKRF